MQPRRVPLSKFWQVVTRTDSTGSNPGQLGLPTAAFNPEYAYAHGATAENLRNTILVSHSGINEDPEKWGEAKDPITQSPRPATGAKRCVNDFAEKTGAKVGFLFTGSQAATRFGGKDPNPNLWAMVDWMPASRCENYRWMHQRFLLTADFYQHARDRDLARIFHQVY